MARVVSPFFPLGIHQKMEVSGFVGFPWSQENNYFLGKPEKLDFGSPMFRHTQMASGCHPFRTGVGGLTKMDVAMLFCHPPSFREPASGGPFTISGFLLENKSLSPLKLETRNKELFAQTRPKWFFGMGPFR